MKDLSILIPARNEEWLSRTIEDILEHREADTEVIATLDGQWADPQIEQHDRVNVIYVPEAIGQRAGQNIACRLAQGKYVMKVDAHCAFDQGFDRKMVETFESLDEEVTMVPVMYTLHVFNWKCMKCGKQWYQGPTPTECQEENYKDTGKPCDNTPEDKGFERKMFWKPRWHKKSTSYLFDSAPHFQYFGEYKKRDEYKKAKEETGLTETMSLQGSAFACSRENYWKWEVCDESMGSWGNQGIEVALATWLTGHRVLVNHNTWYAHLFRTQGGDFGFPWPAHGSVVKRTKDKVVDKFWDMNHPLQEKSVSWLVEKFWPVPGWDEESLARLKKREAKTKQSS